MILRLLFLRPRQSSLQGILSVFFFQFNPHRTRSIQEALSLSMLLVVLGVIIVTSVTGQANILYNSTDCTGAARRVRYTPKVDCEEKGCASNEPFSTKSSLVTCTKTIEEAGNKTTFLLQEPMKARLWKVFLHFWVVL